MVLESSNFSPYFRPRVQPLFSALMVLRRFLISFLIRMRIQPCPKRCGTPSGPEPKWLEFIGKIAAKIVYLGVCIHSIRASTSDLISCWQSAWVLRPIFLGSPIMKTCLSKKIIVNFGGFIRASISLAKAIYYDR